MQIFSLVLGILAILGWLIAFFPCLGSLNWLNIPFAVLGLIVSVIALATTKEASKGGSIAGIVLCSIAVVLGVVRLMMGGGLL
ncbi:MAG: hypothetical protein NTW03_05095 [Verrucomicrobia bacterium]|nr:hypothetical protein [Verrucomicrobiota bacterium]